MCSKYLPKEDTNAKLRRGVMISRRRGRVVCLKWKDKRDVLVLFSKHPKRLITLAKRNRQGEEVQKPDIILDYNRYMGGVDRADQLMSYYNPLRKTLKWYRKVVLHFVDMAVTNLFLIYKNQGGKNDQAWYRRELIKSLVSPIIPTPQRCAKRPLVHHKASDMLSGFDLCLIL